MVRFEWLLPADLWCLIGKEAVIVRQALEEGHMSESCRKYFYIWNEDMRFEIHWESNRN